VSIFQDIGDGWWEGELSNGETGLFPESYAEVMAIIAQYVLPDTVGSCSVLHNSTPLWLLCHLVHMKPIYCVCFHIRRLLYLETTGVWHINRGVLILCFMVGHKPAMYTVLNEPKWLITIKIICVSTSNPYSSDNNQLNLCFILMCSILHKTCTCS